MPPFVVFFHFKTGHFGLICDVQVVILIIECVESLSRETQGNGVKRGSERENYKWTRKQDDEK